MKTIILWAVVALVGCSAEFDSEDTATTSHDLKTISGFHGFGTNASSSLATWPKSIGCPDGCNFLNKSFNNPSAPDQRMLAVCIDSGTNSRIRAAAKQWAIDANTIGTSWGVKVTEHSSATPCRGAPGITITSNDLLSDPALNEPLVAKYGTLSWSSCQAMTSETEPGTYRYCTAARIEIDHVAIDLLAPGHGTATVNGQHVKQATYAFMLAAAGFGQRGNVTTYAHNKFNASTRVLPNAWDHQNDSLRCQARSVPNACALGVCSNNAYDGDC